MVRGTKIFRKTRCWLERPQTRNEDFQNQREKVDTLLSSNPWVESVKLVKNLSGFYKSGDQREETDCTGKFR
jgi:hypothetical protein